MDRDKLVGIIASLLVVLFVAVLHIAYFILMAHVTVYVAQELFDIDWSNKIIPVAIALYIFQTRFYYGSNRSNKSDK